MLHPIWKRRVDVRRRFEVEQHWPRVVHHLIDMLWTIRRLDIKVRHAEPEQWMPHAAWLMHALVLGGD